MNATRRTSIRSIAVRRARRAQAVLARRRRAIVGPRAVLHILVGAITLVTAQALIGPLARTSDERLGGTVVYAEQPRSQTPAVSAPALSTSAPSQTAQQSAPHGDVLTDLGSSIGRTGAPSIESWRGIAGQDVNRRSAPNRSKPPVGTLQAGTPVDVVRWVRGEEVEPRNDTWAELSDGTYVFSTSLRRTGTPTPGPIPADAPATGRWIDVDLGQQIATAYEGTTPLRTVLISSGQPGWETPTGVFPVLRRLEKDTMDGATLLGQGPDGKGADYKVENVRHVQYFTNDGAAIHENYWRRPATFGMPGSHGCIGMLPADAAWFWEFATVGTPLVIHE